MNSIIASPSANRRPRYCIRKFACTCVWPGIGTRRGFYVHTAPPGRTRRPCPYPTVQRKFGHAIAHPIGFYTRPARAASLHLHTRSSSGQSARLAQEQADDIRSMRLHPAWSVFGSPATTNSNLSFFYFLPIEIMLELQIL